MPDGGRQYCWQYIIEYGVCKCGSFIRGNQPRRSWFRPMEMVQTSLDHVSFESCFWKTVFGTMHDHFCYSIRLQRGLVGFFYAAQTGIGARIMYEQYFRLRGQPAAHAAVKDHWPSAFLPAGQDQRGFLTPCLRILSHTSWKARSPKSAASLKSHLFWYAIH